MVVLRYKHIKSFAFVQAFQKIISTPTHGQVASQIHKVGRAVELAQKEITKAFQTEVADVFGKKNEKGELIRPDDEPNGFEPDETKRPEFEAAQKEFGEKTVELNVQPFTIQLLGDIKVSAADLNALHDLYIGNREDQKPPVPTNLAAVK